MVRKLFSILLSALFLLVCAELKLKAFEPVSSRMTERLYQSLIYGDRDAFLSVILYLKDDLDIHALDHSLSLAAAGKKKRYQTVVKALLATAEKSQAALVELLKEAKARGDVRSYQSFWINNNI